MKRVKITMMFLVLSAAVFAQNTGQTVNEGVLTVGPGTLMSVMSDFDNTAMGEYENNGEVIFRGNFNNDGITTFNFLHKGYTRFEGFSQQNLTGSIPADFRDVLFRNPNAQPAFRLYGDLSISGNADFYQGIVQDDVFGGIIIFESEATHTNASKDSHVDGHAIKNGSNDFIFPIGDQNQFRYAAISASEEDKSSFAGKYFLEDSNTLYPHTSKTGVITAINNNEYWTVEKAGGDADILLTLSWDTGTTTPSEIVAAPYEEIHIVRWDEAQQLWVDEGGIADASSQTVTTSVKVTGYGVFTLARVKTEILLPGDIVIYNGVTPGGDGRNDYFIIDKIRDFPKNTVQIYNRWGVKVFETEAYDTKGNVFRGFSDGRVTVTGEKLLPSGTYFYIIEYEYEKPGIPARKIKKAGYLYLGTEQ